MIQFLKDKYYRNRPMVSYWKHAEAVEAKLYRAKDGHMELQMKGEKHPFPGFPRGRLLYGKLSPLKHQIKNKVFNESWALLDQGIDITPRLKSEVYPFIFKMAEDCKYDMVPFEGMVPPVKEIYRALTDVSDGESVDKWRDIITFIFQEDDAYRNRFQWMAKFIKKGTIAEFLGAFDMLEQAEVVGDMKERVRLVKRVLTAILRDPKTKNTFNAFLREIDWKKVKLTEADKYFLRGKYFKTDYPDYAY